MKASHTILLALLTTTACGDTFDTSDEARETWELTAEATAAREAAYAAAEEAQAQQQARQHEGAAALVGDDDEGDVRGGEDVDTREIEELVVDLVNDWRGQEVMCGSERHGPAPPLEMDVHLRNAARKHSKELAVRNVIAHEGEDGSRFWDRAAAFTGTPRGEAVAGGHASAAAVVDAWMNSPDHCLVLMLPEATHVGVGYKFDKTTRFGHFWTLVVGQR